MTSPDLNDGRHDDAPSASTHVEPHRQRLPILAVGALGIVYGDIGTSPLYALREALRATDTPVSETSVFGLLSLIFWSLLLVVTVKYIVIVLRADNRGEGGILAVGALILQDATLSRRFGAGVVALSIAGAALFYGDCLLTPAISVLSAVEGLTVSAPDYHVLVVPVTIAILIALFLAQSRGTGRVGAFFGPIMALWFTVLGTLGAIEIAGNPAVLAAIDPRYGIVFLAHHTTVGLVVLAAVFLAVTGAEALYADMGHFGRVPMRLAWFVVVMPALLLNYFGQGALLLREPDAIANPFFLLGPEWSRLPLVALASAATVIASQAVISGAFSITRQAVQLGYLPRLEFRHTSAHQIGQIYSPQVNYALLIAVIAVVLAFGSSSALAAAYGLSVSATMVITTMLVVIVARRCWNWGPLTIAGILGLLFAIDAVFLVANAVKIPEGGWFPLCIALLLYVTMTTWRRGRAELARRIAADGMKIETFVAHLNPERPVRVPGTAVYMSGTPDEVPRALLHNMKHNKVLHERVVLLTVSTKGVPKVPAAERIAVEQLGKRFYRVRVSYGFMQTPNVPRALELCREHGLEFDLMETSFFLARVALNPGRAMPRWRQQLFAALARNGFGATEFFRLPPNRVVELGSQITL
ncbi:MAG: potassium transporter Kup [Rhodospirillaceae bacterium]|nr:potassium transporter Kup [Rhodospirillaceae bacterium]